MPRRSRGLGSGSQVPIRGLSDLIKNLDPGQADRLRNALVDAEDLLTFHSRNRPENQQRRRISGLVDTITITAVSSVLGGYVSWSRLPDPRIAMYEVQSSDDSVFSNPTSFQLLDTFFSVDGISTVKFIRVRGVRIDGETGLWSNTATLTPNTVAPTVHSIEFYPTYQNPQSIPNVKNSFTFGGGLDPYREQSFYTILSNSFYVDRINGGLSIWGYLGNRLENFTNPGITPWDRVRFTVNGIHRMDSYFPHWTNNFEIDDANKTDFVNFYPNEYISFYARGGYTASFGPYGVPVPFITAGVGPNDANYITPQDASDGTFYWDDVQNAKYPSRFDQAQLTAFNDPNPGHESSSISIDAGKSTHWIVFQDFQFDLPSDAQILGIQADIKRRQTNYFGDLISTNYGVRRPDKKFLGHDLVIEHLLPTQIESPAKSNNILQDVNFGRYLDLTVGRGPNPEGVQSARLDGDISGNGTDGLLPSPNKTKIFTGNKYSISSWIILPGGASIDSTNFVVSYASGTTGADHRLDIEVVSDASSNLITNYNCILQHSGSLSLANFAPSSFISSEASTKLPGVFHHIVYTWDGDVVIGSRNGQPKLYVDGVLRTTGLGLFNKTLDDSSKALTLGSTALLSTTQGRSLLGQCHSAIWNKVLDADEILDLYKAKGFRDYRFNFGDYQSRAALNHYFLFFPNQADIKDLRIHLTDNTGIRTDLENKAITTESWPQLGQFFYTDTRICETIPQASSDGIPHDNHLAIGYQPYGDQFDYWGATSWTPAQINDFYFGIAIQAQNSNSSFFRNNAFIDHAKMTIFTLPESNREVNVSVSASSANQFYLEREVMGALFSAVEIGEKIGNIVS